MAVNNSSRSDLHGSILTWSERPLIAIRVLR
jgi:hypothetical protein